MGLRGGVEERTKAGPKQYFMYHCGVCVGVGKGTVGLYECLGWLGIEVVTRIIQCRSEGTLVKRVFDHVTDTSRGRRSTHHAVSHP